MKTFLVGDCAADHLYALQDPDASSETELEFAVAKALSCVYPTHKCIVFGGGFRYDERIYRPDLALVAKDYSHWFVIEVELVSHSFEKHVLPQVRAFRYGEPQADCVTVLARELGVPRGRAMTLVEMVPRSVAVIANKRDNGWEIALRAHDIQLLSVAVFRTTSGVEAVEVDGELEILSESLGFGLYSATDRSLRFHRAVRLPTGPVQISDPSGTTSSWTVSVVGDTTWVTKDFGLPDLEHGTHVQVIRTIEGQLSLRRPRSTRVEF